MYTYISKNANCSVWVACKTHSCTEHKNVEKKHPHVYIMRWAHTIWLAEKSVCFWLAFRKYLTKKEKMKKNSPKERTHAMRPVYVSVYVQHTVNVCFFKLYYQRPTATANYLAQLVGCYRSHCLWWSSALWILCDIWVRFVQCACATAATTATATKQTEGINSIDNHTQRSSECNGAFFLVSSNSTEKNSSTSGIYDYYYSNTKCYQ